MKRQWITCICFLVLAAGVIAGVSVFAGEHKVGAVTKVSIKQGGTKMLRWSKISPKNRKKIKWKSSSTRIVSVSTHGKIQAKRTGKAVITAKTNSNKEQRDQFFERVLAYVARLIKK